MLLKLSFYFRLKVDKHKCDLNLLFILTLCSLLLVDFNSQIKMVNLWEYKETVCDETWRVFTEMVNEFKEKKLRVSFFNSTPQGGGGKFQKRQHFII